MKKELFLLIGFTLVIQACKDNDPAPETKLFTFTTTEEYVYPNYENWFFISDADGNVVDVQQVQNNETYKVKTAPAHQDGARYILSTVHYRAGTSGVSDFLRIYSYQEVLPGSYTLFKYPSTGPEIVGTHQLVIHNYPGDEYFTTGAFGENVGSDGGGPVAGTTDFKVNSVLASPTVDVTYYILLNQPAVPKYLRLKGVTDCTKEVDYSNLLDMNLHATLSLPGVINSTWSLSAFSSSGNEINVFNDFGNLVSENFETVNVYVPELIYPRYTSQVSYEKNKVGYSYTMEGTQPFVTYKELDSDVISFTMADNKMEIELSKPTDEFDVSGFSTVPGPNHPFNLLWIILAEGKTHISAIVPTIPDKLIEAYPQLGEAEFNYDTYSMTESTLITNYDDMIKNIFSSKTRGPLGNYERLLKGGPLF